MSEILSQDSFRHARAMVYCGSTAAQNKIHVIQLDEYIKALEATVEALSEALRGELVGKTARCTNLICEQCDRIANLREEGWLGE